MLYSTDLKANLADDLIIKDDILLEADPYKSAINNAERRISSRYDDFVLDAISAGIERFLQKRTEYTYTDIKYAIRSVLASDGLMSNGDFEIEIPETNTENLQIYLKINHNIATTEKTFRIVINIKNQMSYRN